MPDQQGQACLEHDPLHCSCDEERDRAAGIHRVSGLDDGFGGYLCVCLGGRYSVKYGCMAPAYDNDSEASFDDD